MANHITRRGVEAGGAPSARRALYALGTELEQLLVQRRQAGPQQKAAKAKPQYPQSLAGNAPCVGRSAQGVLVARASDLRIFHLCAQLLG